LIDTDEDNVSKSRKLITITVVDSVSLKRTKKTTYRSSALRVMG